MSDVYKSAIQELLYIWEDSKDQQNLNTLLPIEAFSTM